MLTKNATDTRKATECKGCNKTAQVVRWLGGQTGYHYTEWTLCTGCLLAALNLNLLKTISRPRNRTRE